MIHFSLRLISMEGPYVVIAFSLILIFIATYAGAYTYKHVKVTRNRSLLALVFSWFSWAIAVLCNIIAYVVNYFYPHDVFFYWKFIMILAFFFQIIGLSNLILFVDTNAQSRASLVKIAIVSVIGSLYISLPFVDEELLQYNDTTLYTTSGLLFLVQLIFGLYNTLVYLLWIFRIWRNSPKTLKRITSILFFVWLSSALSAFVGFAASKHQEINIIANYTFYEGAILSIAIAIRVEPQIINVLPFVANRLLVMNQTSGVLLYEHIWSDEEEKNLSAFIHGIQKVSQEKFQVGKLKSLELDEGIVLLDHSEKFSFALLTTKSTKYLELCFKNFKENFINEFERRNISLEGVIDTTDFEYGNELVKKYFKYIPSRLKN